MKCFHVAIIGCGGVSRMHLDGYSLHPERVRVVAACDPDPERREQAQARYGIPRAFASVEELLACPGWEAGVVCTPTPLREALITQLAAAGKHVFVEKPLASTLEEARRMVAACAAAGVHLAVDQNFRYHYSFHLVRHVLEWSRLGLVTGLVHQDLMWRQDAGWRVQAGRHALSVMGIHWLDGFRWMLRSEAASLSCRTRSSGAIQCAGETDAWVQIAFERGATASYVQSFSSPVAKTETLLLTERGALAFGYAGAALYKQEPRGRPVEEWQNVYAGPGKVESAFRCLDELLCAIETGEEPANSGRDNLKTMSLLEACYRSAVSGQTVTFEGGELR